MSERGNELVLFGIGVFVILIVLVLMWELIPDDIKSFEFLEPYIPQAQSTSAYPTLEPVGFPGQERFPESLYPDGPPKDWPNATWIPTEIENMQTWKRTQIAIQGTVYPYEKEDGE